MDTYNKAIDFVKWLWKNYREDANWNPPGRSDSSSFKYNFPCVKGGSIKDSEKLFLGSDYNNSLGEKLFDEGYGAFPPASVFDISDNDTELFKDFICKFGVKEYPEIETQEVSPIDTYSFEYEKEIRASGELGQSTWADYKYNLPYIKGLEDLLKDLSTTEIVEWIIKDKLLYSYLSNPYYTSNAEISFSGNYQKYWRTYCGSIKNYILEVFNEVRWIEIDEKLYSPRQILQNFNSKNNNKFKGSIPVIGHETLASIAQKLNVEVDKVYDVFKKFEFAYNVTDLCSEDFYGLMLKLPTMDFSKSAELSQIIYRIVEQSTFSKTFEDSYNKKEFFEKGKVLVNYKGQLQYLPAKDAFLPSITIVDKRNVPIVKMGTRKNIENFVRLFNCQKYNRKYSVIEDSISISPANADFQKYYDEFKKYARAYAEKNDNIERYARDLRISLVNKISISENGKSISIDEEYEYIRDTITSWYIIVFDTHYDVNTISEIIENIYSNIANTSGFDAGKLGELFRAKEKSDREFLIKKEFGSLSVIEDDHYKNDIRNSFIETLRSIIPAYDIEEIKINFDDFFNIENTPLIIELFKEIGTDADSFMKAGFGYAIDLVPYYKKELKSFIQRERRRFKNVLFTRTKADEKLQPYFFDTIDRFENFFIQDFKNTVTFDIEKILVDEFGEWRDDETVLFEDKEYAENYEAMNPHRKFEDIIAKDKKVQLMIYFNKTDEFKSWLEVNEKREQKNEIPDADYYSRFKNVVPHKKEIAYHQTANTMIYSSSNEKNSSHSGSFNQNESEKRRKNQKRYGNIGEQLIYNLLCKRVGEENVFPRSEAFLDLNIRKPGQTVSGEYDMSYIDKDGIEYFAEVKTGDGKSFIITSGELQFAKENAEKYKLFIVYNIDAEIPDYLELPIRFWEDDRYRKNEVIERIEFEF